MDGAPLWREVIVVVSLCLANCLVPVAFSEQPEPSLTDLEWIAGHWKATVDGVVMEEGWFKALGGVMLGVHRDVRPGKSAFFEFLRIEEREDGIVYVASPMGRGATDFYLVRIGDEMAVFENLDHDFPQRIMYSREGDRLTATVEGLVEGGIRSTSWEWTLEP